MNIYLIKLSSLYVIKHFMIGNYSKILLKNMQWWVIKNNDHNDKINSNMLRGASDQNIKPIFTKFRHFLFIANLIVGLIV